MSSHPNRPLQVLATALLGSSLLAACGGGGDEGPLQPVAVAKPTAVLAEVGPVTDQCGIASLATQVASGQAALNVNRTSIDIGGYALPVTYLVSGDYYETQSRMDVRLPQADLRAPVVSLDPGAATMGVAMTGPYLLGSVACVKAVGRAWPVASPTTATYEMTWSSSGQPVLPVQTLPHPPVNGFEFLGNFEAQNPSAVFTLGDHALSDPAEARICRYEGGNDWACVVPQINKEGATYTFSTPMTAKGVYMLSVPSAPMF
jgi:hypothetical protein